MKHKYNKLLFAAWSTVGVGLAFTSISIILLIQTYNLRATRNTDLLSEFTIPESDFSSNQLYNARCGLDLLKCSVRFSEGKLLVSDYIKIKRSQFRSIVKSSECRQRFILMPILTTCLKSQKDRDFTISYAESNGLIKSIQITFRPGHIANHKKWKSFQKDLQTWIGAPFIEAN